MPSDALRDWLAGQVRSRVVGTSAPERAAELFDAPGERWFEAGTPICQVHADASMFIGGLRALLLQSLHPLAMAGVAEHSDYRTDPWGRLQRTADFIAATTFGPAAEAERAVARVRRVHQHVRGVSDDGRPYSALDPHLLRWVHIAEIDSFLAAHTHYGRRPLEGSDRDEYVAQTAVVARKLGVPAPPESERALRDQLRSYRRELKGTREAREVAQYLLVQPPMPIAVRPAYLLLGGAAVALLPRWARAPLRLPYLPIAERVAIRPAGEVVTRTLRWALSQRRPAEAPD
ncbi:MAG: oxygenase MpaB family protein [Ilumatobacteraceae bacterium]